MTAALGNPFTLGNTGVTTSTRYDRLALGATFRPGAAALSAASGFLAGPAGTMGDLTLLTDVLLRVDPFLAVVQGTHNTQQGQYVVPNVQQRDLAVPAKDASLFRKALVRVRVADSLEAGVASSGTTDGAWLEVVSGALAASNPALPALGDNAFAAGELSIPSTASGLPVTLTKYNPRTGTRGGILPVTATDTIPGAYVGEFRDHPTYGLQRWTGTFWKIVNPAIVAVSAYQTANRLVGSGWQAIICQTERYDPFGMHDAATGIVTAPLAGVYRLNGMAVIELNATGQRGSGWQTRANSGAAWGSFVHGSAAIYAPPGSANAGVPTPAILLPLAAGAQVQLYGYQNAGTLNQVGTASATGQQSSLSVELVDHTG